MCVYVLRNLMVRPLPCASLALGWKFPAMTASVQKRHKIGRKRSGQLKNREKKKKNCSDFTILIRWVFLVRSDIVLRGHCLQWETWTNIALTTTSMQNPTTFSHASAKLPNSQPSAQLRGRRELLNSSQHLAKKTLISFSAHNLTEEEENKAEGRGVCEGVAWGRKKKRILFRKKCREKKKWSKHGRHEAFGKNVGIVFALPLRPLSGEWMENVNRQAQEHTCTQPCTGLGIGDGGIGGRGLYEARRFM